MKDGQVSKSFESGFLSQSLEAQIEDCGKYELASLFLRCFREQAPVLEAGCGSGRWCGWLTRHGIQCDGIDWSQALCERAALALPQSRFIACDMRHVPLPRESYGGIMALGSIEHSPEGPLEALREFQRLLRPGGRAVITVPYGGRLRLWMQRATSPLLTLKSWSWIRRLLGKPVGAMTLSQARAVTRSEWHPRFAHGPEGWFFFEYEFNKAQMREFFADSGFDVREEFVGFGDEGILHTFGRLSGKWDHDRAVVAFTWLGRMLRALIPVRMMGHMLCYVVEKPGPQSMT